MTCIEQFKKIIAKMDYKHMKNYSWIIITILQVDRTITKPYNKTIEKPV